jgi:polar amino acid transport system ATP-binding protein
MNAIADMPSSASTSGIATPPGAPLIEVRDLRKRFGEVDVLRGVDLEIARSEVVCIIGPSGSGKSTLLRCLAALETYDQGDVRIEGELLGYSERNGKRVRASQAQINRVRRNVGMVFQQFNLWPHMSALGNVMEALLRVRHVSRDEAPTRCSKRSASRTRAMRIRPNCRAASNNVWRLRGRLRWSRTSCCSTSRPRRSIRNWSAKCCR